MVEFLVDWDNDGVFEEDEEVTPWVLRAEWRIGLDRPGDHVARVGRLRMWLDNRDGRFNPQNASGPLYGMLLPRRRVLVRTGSPDGATFFMGYIERITPNVVPGPSNRICLIEAVDGMEILRAHKLDLPLQRGKRSDELVETIIKATAWPPATTGYFVLDGAYLDSSTRLGGAETGMALESGQGRYIYAGDSWHGERVSSLEALSEVARSEWGVFYISRDGTAVFLDRSWKQRVTAPDLILEGGFSAVEYGLDIADVVAEVIVEMRPRELGLPGTVLWQAHGDVRVSPGTERVIRALFHDGNGNRIGAVDVITPVEGTDYVADGPVSVSMDVSANAARLVLSTDGGSPVRVSDLRLRGTPLRDFDGLVIRAYDTGAAQAYQKRTLVYHAPLLDDLNVGEQMAKWLLLLHKTPGARLRRITFDGADDNVLGVSLFDVIRVPEDMFDAGSGDYFVVAEEHKVEGVCHEVSWLLEPLPPQGWLLGYAGRGELGSATRLGF